MSDTQRQSSSTDDPEPEPGDNQSVQARKKAIASTSGMFSGLYPEDYLEELRQDWPD